MNPSTSTSRVFLSVPANAVFKRRTLFHVGVVLQDPFDSVYVGLGDLCYVFCPVLPVVPIANFLNECIQGRYINPLGNTADIAENATRVRGRIRFEPRDLCHLLRCIHDTVDIVRFAAQTGWTRVE